MRIYDISQGNDIKAYLFIQDNGQKTWDFSPDEWGDQWLRAASKTAIEQAVESYPSEEVLSYSGLTIRQRA